jgi:hypothetical protein
VLDQGGLDAIFGIELGGVPQAQAKTRVRKTAPKPKKRVKAKR